MPSIERRDASPVEILESRRLLSSAVALTENNRLFQFDTGDLTEFYKETRIKGLSAGDRVVGLDFRASGEDLYGLVNGTSVDRVIKINPVNGKTSNTFTLTTPLAGDDFGVDFNPVADALRITSNAGQNLRVPFATGATIVDGPIAFNANDLNAGATPNVVASAYTNSFNGTTSTILYNVDAALDAMTLQNPPNAGTQVTRGPLGVDTTSVVGFDIEGANALANLTNAGYVSLKRAADAGSRLYRINLATGATTDVGPIGGTADPRVVRDVTFDLARVRPTASGQALQMAIVDGRATDRGDDRREDDDDRNADLI